MSALLCRPYESAYKITKCEPTKANQVLINPSLIEYSSFVVSPLSHIHRIRLSTTKKSTQTVQDFELKWVSKRVKISERGQAPCRNAVLASTFSMFEAA